MTLGNLFVYDADQSAARLWLVHIQVVPFRSQPQARLLASHLPAAQKPWSLHQVCHNRNHHVDDCTHVPHQTRLLAAALQTVIRQTAAHLAYVLWLSVLWLSVWCWRPSVDCLSCGCLWCCYLSVDCLFCRCLSCCCLSVNCLSCGSLWCYCLLCGCLSCDCLFCGCLCWCCSWRPHLLCDYLRSCCLSCDCLSCGCLSCGCLSSGCVGMSYRHHLQKAASQTHRRAAQPSASTPRSLSC